MTLIELRDKLIEHGIETVNQNPRLTGIKRSGSVMGFELCRNYNTFEELDAAIVQRQGYESRMRRDGVTGDRYWGHRWATIQMEFVLSVLNVAVQAYPVSYIATMAYAKHVGTLGDGG